MKIMNNKGRPKKYDFTVEEKEFLVKFIRTYDENYNPYSTIKYKHIWEYTLQQYDENTFPYKTSYDFWKRKGRTGRELVDSINSVSKEFLAPASRDNIDLIRIQKLIEDYGGKNKQILWDNLEPVQNQTEQYIERINKINDKYSQLLTEIDEQNKIIEELSTKNKELQDLTFALFTYSNKNNELENLINMEQSKSEIINLALSETFINPKGFIDELVSRLDIQKPDKQNTSEKSLKIITLENRMPEYDL